MKCVLGLFMLCLLACTENKYAGIPEKYHALLDQALVKAGDNATELTAALKNAPDNQKEGMAFLIAYMPERDLKELTADFLLDRVEQLARRAALSLSSSARMASCVSYP